MIRKSFPHYLVAGCVVLFVAGSAAAQCNPCPTPTVAFSPVQVQTFQPVVVEEPRSWCCLCNLCDWIWGRNRTTVAAAPVMPAPVMQTFAYPPSTMCPAPAGNPCGACGTNPCCCPSMGAAPSGTPSTFAPTYAGSRVYPAGGNGAYAHYAAAPATHSTARMANSIQGAPIQPGFASAPPVQWTSYQVPNGPPQTAGYYAPATSTNATYQNLNAAPARHALRTW